MNVAVVCRRKAFDEDRQKHGWWSYPVPDFTWTFYPVSDGEAVDRDALAAQGHQAIFWEDWAWNTWTGSALPVMAHIVDSNTSPRRRQTYLARARQADVILVDQDHLNVFGDLNRPVYRWAYGVNEHIFCPREKRIDVAYHVARTTERAALGGWLEGFCNQHGYSLTIGGGRTIEQYAALLGQARIVVHRSSAPQCRSHRFFDALASRCCLLSDPIQGVPEDGLRAGTHYLTYESPEALGEQLDALLRDGVWAQTAAVGYQFVLARHTWANRAALLHSILEAEGWTD